MKVFLIGFMGSGKSTMGQELANLLRWDFVDLDRYIEVKHQKTIGRLFHSFGEDYFRSIERDALREVTQTERSTVIATGGGTPCHHNGMTFMKEEGLTVYLKVSTQALVQRLLSSTKERPLLTTDNPLELEKLINRLLSTRKNCYEQSELIVENSGQGTANTLHKIISFMA